MITTLIHRNQMSLKRFLIVHRSLQSFKVNQNMEIRALGNRSILFDPTHPRSKKDIVNSVKKREKYRPLHVPSWKSMHMSMYRWDNSSPVPTCHLHFNVPTKQKRKSQHWFIWMEPVGYKQSMKIKTRITTILSKQCIKRMVYLLFLIPLNLHGEPLVESIYDAIHTCNNSEINHLYVPEDQDIFIPYEMVNVKGELEVDNSETNRNIV